MNKISISGSMCMPENKVVGVFSGFNGVVFAKWNSRLQIFEQVHQMKWENLLGLFSLFIAVLEVETYLINLKEMHCKMVDLLHIQTA